MINPILKQIAQEIDAVTAEQLEAVMLLDVQEGEEIIGSVAEYPYIRRVWALANDYDRRSSLAVHSIRFGGPKNREQLIQETHRLEEVEELVRSLAWIEIKLALPQLWDCESIGLRDGWVVVKTESSRQKMNDAMTALRDVIGRGVRAQRKPPEEEEEQVQ